MRNQLDFLLPLFSMSLLLSISSIGAMEQDENFRVGLILDGGSAVGKIILTSVDMALHDFYKMHPNSTRKLRIHRRDSSGDVVDAASAAIDLIQNEKVEAIVGPQTSVEAVFVADLGTTSRVPIVSFTATSPSVSPKEKPNFVRTAPNDGAQAAPIAAFVRAFGWKRVILVYEDNIYGSGAIPSLFDALTEVEARVPCMKAVSPSASNDWILKELYRLKTMQTRVFIVHVGAPLASRFFPLVHEAGMMSKGFVWVITQGLAEVLHIMDSVVIDSMDGVIAVKPYIAKTKALEEFKKRWIRNFRLENPDSPVYEPTAVGLRAYDAIWALAAGAETARNSNAGYQDKETTDISTDMTMLGTSLSGPEILEAIIEDSFDGLSGKFSLVDREIHYSEYEIVNLSGKSHRTVGVWASSSSSSWSSSENLRPIVWPGDTTTVPKGWETPVDEKKITIGVPRTPSGNGFEEIIKVEYDPSTGATIASGFVIEVFEEAVKRLPYAVPFQYVAHDGEYDNLVDQIALKSFDGVVGDITITFARSKEVDFTVPFSERGVAMVVPVKDRGEGNGWIFLRPMELPLWGVAGAFLFLTGVVVWVLEHRVNRSFRGSHSSQIGSMLYFIFSTLVYAHREKVVSNLSRLVIIVWLFVVLVLTSSYTANLASMFTVRRLEPKYNDIGDIMRKGEYVGYPENSFILKILKDIGFQEYQLKPYRTVEEYATALGKGSSKGGVSAIVDEIPYLGVFLKDRCSSYSITNMIYNSEGFGFAFSVGSPLAIDLSRSILNMTGENKVLEIENRWFAPYKDCPVKERNASQNILDFKSFWGLFLISGLAFTISLFFSLFSFFRMNWTKVSP